MRAVTLSNFTDSRRPSRLITSISVCVLVVGYEFAGSAKSRQLVQENRVSSGTEQLIVAEDISICWVGQDLSTEVIHIVQKSSAGGQNRWEVLWDGC